MAPTASTPNAAQVRVRPATSATASTKNWPISAANSQPRMRARCVRPNTAATSPTSTALPSVNSVSGWVARLPARPAPPASRPSTNTTTRVPRSSAARVAIGGGVSARPSIATTNTTSAAEVEAGQAVCSAIGAISSVIATPGRITGTDSAALPPKPVAASAAAAVSSTAASRLVGSTAPADGAMSAAIGPCQTCWA